MAMSAAERKQTQHSLRAVLFDYGGVLAEEGFRAGLYSLARRFGVEPQALYRAGQEAVYSTGFVLGWGSEADFWRALREHFPLTAPDAALTAEILRRFVLRPGMIEVVRELRRRGLTVAILSDQTGWLDRLDARDRVFREFDRVYISYRLGKGKRDSTLFDDVAGDLGVAPGDVLFVDDDPGNVARARARGLRTILYVGEADFKFRLAGMLTDPGRA